MNKAQGKRTRGVVILNEGNLRRVKIRFDGPDADGKNTSYAISVLAENIEVVRDKVLESLRKA